MIVAMAVLIHHTAAVPEGRPPTAPVRMGVIGVENKPTAFHLRITQLLTAPTGHLAFVQRQVHMLGRIAFEIIDA